MADDKKNNPSTTSKANTAKPSRSLSPASESSDPAVHQLLAELQTARSNDNADEAKRLTEQLADLGYE